MGIDTVALVHCRKPRLIEQICSGPLGDDTPEQLERVERSAQAGEELPFVPSFSVLGSGRDYVTLFTGVRFAELEEDPIFLQVLAHRIVESLPEGAHDGPRLFFFPDSAEPGGDSYAEVLTALEGACIAAPVKAPSASAMRAWRDARMAAMEEGVEKILEIAAAHAAATAAESPSKPDKASKSRKKPTKP